MVIGTLIDCTEGEPKKKEKSLEDKTCIMRQRERGSNKLIIPKELDSDLVAQYN